MSDELIAVHVTDDLAEADAFRARFERQLPGIKLVVVESPYRELVRPLVHYLELTADRTPSVVTVVLLPERIIGHWWEQIFYNQNAHRIRDALTGYPGILVAEVPFRRLPPPQVVWSEVAQFRSLCARRQEGEAIMFDLAGHKLAIHVRCPKC